MTRDVDETYWHDYFRTHNERRFKELVTGFYAEDALFSNPKAEARGREQIIAFLEGANRDVQIDLLPSSILVQPGVTAIELQCVMRAQKNLPDFLLGPMKTGEEASMPMAAVYHMAGDLIARARIYWGRCP
jgi:hypothetical protein